MTKRDKTRQPVDDAGNPYVSAADQIALASVDRDAAVTAAEADRDLARAQAHQLQMQLAALQAEKTLGEARDRAARARLERKRLADTIAERYAISWETHVFDPHTGRILPIKD